MPALVFALVLFAGYATQRGSVCAVAATRELVVRHKGNRFVGFLFCAACGLGVMAIGCAFGLPVFDSYTGYPVSVGALIGGAIVGIGAYINGRCAFGTVAELGSGSLPRIATLIGFVGGSWLGNSAHMGITVTESMVSPLAGLSAWAVLLIAGAALTVCAVLLLRLQHPGPAHEWTPMQAMAIIGISNGILLVLAQGWPYTSLLMEIATGGQHDLARRGLMAGAFVAGAIAGGVMIGRFHLSGGSSRDWLRAAAGGAVMGAGAVLVPGGNDAMLLVGVPLLLPNLVAAYLSMSLALIVIVAAASRIGGGAMRGMSDQAG